MPSVGTAYVNIRVSTKGFEKSLDTVMKRLSSKMEAAGTQMGKDFDRGLNSTNPYKTLEDRSSTATTSILNNHKKIGDSSDRMAVNMADSSDLARRHIDDLTGSLNGARGSMGKLGQSTSSTRRSLLSLGGASGRSGGGFRSAGNDAGFFRGKLGELISEAPRGVQVLNRLHDTAAFAGTGLAALVGGLSAVGQGIFVVGANAAAAAPSLAIFTNGLMSMAQVGGVLGLAMKGVGGAIGLGLKDAAATAADTGKAADGMKDAIAAAARGVRDAKDALQDAYRAAARAAEDAARRTADAERALAAAQLATTIAQKGLNAARAEAIEQLEDIAFAAEDASLAEDRAALSLADAHQKLLAVSELAPDDRARVEAELAFKEADLQMRQAVDRREDADKEQRQAAKTGIQGTDAMIDAHQAVADAKNDEIDATRDLADARREEAQTAEDNADRIAEALQNVRDAQQALADAHKGTAAAATAAATAANAYADALAKLGPEQRKFVETIVAMRDEFQAFSNAVSEPLFKDLNVALAEVNQKGEDGTSIMDVLTKGLQGTSRQLGDTALKASDLASNDIFQEHLASAMKSNNRAIGNFGGALVNLADAFVSVADAAGPLFIRFSKWVEAVTGEWAKDASGDIDGMTEKFNTAGDRVSEFWELFKQLWRTLRLVGTAANQAANGFKWTDKKTGKDKTGYIPSLTASLKDFNDALDPGKGKRNEGMIARFTQTLNTMNAAGRAVKNAIIDPLIAMGQDKDLETAFNTIAESDAFDKLAETAGDAVPELAELVTNVADFLAEISKSGSLDTFLGLLADIAGFLADIAGKLDSIKIPAALTTLVDSVADLLGLDVDTKGDSLLKWIGYLAGSLSALAFTWKIFKIGSSPFVKAFSGLESLWTGVKDTPGKVRSAFSEISRIAQNSFKSIANLGTRFTNLFRAPDQKKALRATTAREPVPETDSAEAAQARTAGEKIGLAYAEGLKIGQAEVKVQLEAMEASIKANLNAMETTLTIEGEGVGLHIMQGISEGLKVGEIDTLNDARRAGAAIIDAVKNGAGIASPPPEMIAAGGDIMEGLEIGIREGQVEATAAGRTAGAAVAQSVVQGTDTAQASVVAAGADIGDGVTTGVAGGIDKGTKGGKIGGSLGRMGKVFSGASKVMGGAMRGLGGAMNFMMGPWGMLIMILLPILMPLLQKLNDKFHITDKIMAVLKTTVEKVGDAFKWVWDKIKELFDWVKANWPLILGILTGPIGLAVLAITKNWDKVKAVFEKLWDWLKNNWDLLLAIITGPFGLAVRFIIKHWRQIIDFIKGMPARLKKFLDKLWDPIGEKLTDAWNAVRRKWTEIIGWIKYRPTQFRINMETIWDVFTDKLSDAWDWIVRKWDNILSWLGKLPGKVANKLSGLWNGFGEGLISATNWIGGTLNGLIGNLNSVLGTFHVPEITFRFPEDRVWTGFARGGPVFGPGTGTSDSIPARLSRGEHVLTAKEVVALGGHGKVSALRKAAMNGRPIEGGTGGIVGWVKDRYDDVKDAIKSGAAAAFKWALSKFKALVEPQDNIVKQLAVGVMDWAADAITGKGENLDEAAAAAAAASGAPYTGPPGGWTYPLARRYGITQYPNAGHSPPWSVDIGAPSGVAVRAASRGIAYIKSLGNTSYGNYVVVSHAGGQETLYAHLRSFAVKNGQSVKTGQTLGYSDSTGNSTGNHLHFELKPSSSTIAAMAAHGVKLARGGVVAPTASGTLALLAEAGKHERVTPLDNEGFTPAERRMLEALEESLGMGGGGDTYHVHPTPGMNEAEVADLVMRRVAWKRRRGTGR